MAPIRRYLRITKYSALECRIYLDNPALAQSWLLHPAHPVLPRVIESVRPLVLPKLREEKERARKKNTKRKGIKDVVVEDDFEVAIFLTETSTRHSILYKHRHFRDKMQTKLVSNNANRLTGASREAPIDVDDRGLTVELPEAATAEEEDDDDIQEIPANLLREDSDEGDAAALLADIPSVNAQLEDAARLSKRRRSEAVDYVNEDEDAQEIGDSDSDFDIDDEEVARALAAEEAGNMPPPNKRLKESESTGPDAGGPRDDKKKMKMDISYEGFAIYGRVLCLVIKKRDGAATTTAAAGKTAAAAPRSRPGAPSSAARAAPGGQGMMEDWITSTQTPAVVPDEPDPS